MWLGEEGRMAVTDTEGELVPYTFAEKHYHTLWGAEIFIKVRR